MANHDQLRYALAQYLGETLTPEGAAHILAMAEAAAHPIALELIVPKLVRGYVMRAERMADILAELHPLHERHWLETEGHRHGLPLNPDYAGMLSRERNGTLIQFTLRHQGTLVGNLRMYLGVDMHTGTQFAKEDTLYLAPEHRGGFLVLHFMRYTEWVLRALGVRQIMADSKLVNGADVLMRRMGYTPVALQFVKVFPAEAEAQTEEKHVCT